MVDDGFSFSIFYNKIWEMVHKTLKNFITETKKYVLRNSVILFTCNCIHEFNEVVKGIFMSLKT